MKPLVHKKYLLQKFPGKGGWTYALIPEILQDKHAPFGWVRVSGTIDGYPIQAYHLMPFGNGQLFLPVKAAIRKAIQKKEGDTVEVILYADGIQEMPDDFKSRLMDEPDANRTYNSYTEAEQSAFLEWIFSANDQATRLQRIQQAIEMLLRKEKMSR